MGWWHAVIRLGLISGDEITIDSKWVRWVSDSVMWCLYWWHHTHQSWWHHKRSGVHDLLQNCTTQGGEKSIDNNWLITNHPESLMKSSREWAWCGFLKDSSSTQISLWWEHLDVWPTSAPIWYQCPPIPHVGWSPLPQTGQLQLTNQHISRFPTCFPSAWPW